MSSTDAPQRRSFTAFVEKAAAETIDLCDDDGNVLLAVPKPQFWGKDAEKAAKSNDVVKFWQLLVGKEAFAEFCERFPYDEVVCGNNAMAFVVEEIGGASVGELLASSQS